MLFKVEINGEFSDASRDKIDEYVSSKLGGGGAWDLIGNSLGFTVSVIFQWK